MSSHPLRKSVANWEASSRLSLAMSVYLVERAWMASDPSCSIL